MRAEEGPGCSDPSAHAGPAPEPPPALHPERGDGSPLSWRDPRRSRLRVGSLVDCHVTRSK